MHFKVFAIYCTNCSQRLQTKKAQICMHSSPKRLRNTFFLLKWYYFLVRDKLYNLNIWVVIEEKCIIPCIDQANKAHVSTEQVQRLSYIS